MRDRLLPFRGRRCAFARRRGAAEILERSLVVFAHLGLVHRSPRRLLSIAIVGTKLTREHFLGPLLGASLSPVGRRSPRTLVALPFVRLHGSTRSEDIVCRFLAHSFVKTRTRRGAGYVRKRAARSRVANARASRSGQMNISRTTRGNTMRKRRGRSPAKKARPCGQQRHSRPMPYILQKNGRLLAPAALSRPLRHRLVYSAGQMRGAHSETKPYASRHRTE